MNELCVRYPGMPKVPFIAYTEFLFGLRNRQERRKQESLTFLDNFDVVHTTRETAFILAHLTSRYGHLPMADLFIAAQALEHSLILVTRDKDFQAIDEIQKIII